MNAILNPIQEWLPWIAIALLAGILNVFVAFKKLQEICKFLPFFEPQQNLWIVVWELFQLALPATVFWMVFGLSAKPPITVSLVSQAITFGVNFVLLATALSDVGFFSANINSIYDGAASFVKDRIAASQTRKTAEFWTDFKKELSQAKPEAIDAGLDYLEEYFREDISLTLPEKRNYLEQIAHTRTLTAGDSQTEAIKSLMEIRRQDLPKVLERFACWTLLSNPSYFTLAQLERANVDLSRFRESA